MSNMRFTDKLKRRFIFLLTALVLLQVVPIGAMAHESALSPKAKSQQPAELDQDLAKPQDASQSGNSWRSKLAADLERSVDVVTTGHGHDKMSSVIIQLKDKTPAGQNIKGIMVTDIKRTMLGHPSVRADLQAKFERLSGKLKNTFNTMGLISAEMPLSRIRDLQYDDDIAYVSPDRPIASYGHVEQTIGATDARPQVAGFTSINGTGVGIAVLDSGIDNSHNLIKASQGRPSVVYSRTYTGIAGNKDY